MNSNVLELKLCIIQDGVLDQNEVQQWVMPDDYDHAIAESKHLIFEADTDKVSDLYQAVMGVQDCLD